MNIILGTAALSVSAKPLNAQKLPQATSPADLIGAFETANKTLGAALDLIDDIEAKPLSSPPIRVLGGKTEPVTLVLSDRTEVIPATEWFFHSGDQIRKGLEKSLKRGSASEHEAIKERYAGYWSEYVRQYQANKKASSAKRLFRPVPTLAGRELVGIPRAFGMVPVSHCLDRRSLSLARACLAAM
jgi:hypothetical protein